MQNLLEYRIIKQAVKGNNKAFEQLIQPYEKKIYNIAIQMFKNREDAYDASQEIFIKVYKNLRKFNFDSAFGTWLHRLAVNTCIDEYRKRRRHRENTTSFEVKGKEGDTLVRELPDKEKIPEEQVIQKEIIKEVHKAMNQLDAQQKMILIYREIEEYSYEEISEVLDCNIGTVKSRIFRARQALKKIILENREQINS